MMHMQNRPAESFINVLGLVNLKVTHNKFSCSFVCYKNRGLLLLLFSITWFYCTSMEHYSVTNKYIVNCLLQVCERLTTFKRNCQVMKITWDNLQGEQGTEYDNKERRLIMSQFNTVTTLKLCSYCLIQKTEVTLWKKQLWDKSHTGLVMFFSVKNVGVVVLCPWIFCSPVAINNIGRWNCIWQHGREGMMVYVEDMEWD